MKLKLQFEEVTRTSPTPSTQLISDLKTFIKNVENPKPSLVENTAMTPWLFDVDLTAEGCGFKIVADTLVYENPSAEKVTIGQIERNASDSEYEGTLSINGEAFHTASLGYLTQLLEQKKQELEQGILKKNQENSSISYICPWRCCINTFTKKVPFKRLVSTQPHNFQAFLPSSLYS